MSAETDPTLREAGQGVSSAAQSRPQAELAAYDEGASEADLGRSRLRAMGPGQTDDQPTGRIDDTVAGGAAGTASSS